MSAEPIDIEVTDKIPTSIRDKLLGIASAALDGFTNLNKLQSQLDKLDSSSITNLSNAQKTLEAQTAKNNLSYLAQEAALNKAITAEQKAAASVQLLAAAQSRAETAALAAAAAAGKAAQADQNSASAAIDKARAIQTAADAQERYNAVLGVGSSSGKSAKDSAAVFVEAEAAAISASKAVNAFGETEAQVTARLKSVSAAGAQLANQQQAVAVTASEATASEKALTSATTAAGGAATDAAKRYSNYMSALNTLNKGASPIDPAAVQKSTAALHDMQGATAGVTRELIVLGHEAVSGNFSRIPGSLLVLTERTGSFGASIELLLTIFTPFRALLAVITALFIVYEKLVASSEDETRKFNNTLKLTGDIAGLTLDSFNEMSDGIAKANNVTISSAKGAVSQLAASGKFQADQIAQFGDSAEKLSKITGQSVDQIVKEFIRAADAPEKYAETLERTTQFISPAQLEHIRQLQLMGDTAEATRVLSESLFDSLQRNAPAALTGLAKLWNDVKTAVDGYIDSARKAANSAQNGPSNADLLETARNTLAEAEANKAKYAAIEAGNPIVEKLIAANQKTIDQAKDQIASIQDGLNLQQEQVAQASQAAAASKEASLAVTQLGTAYDGAKGNVVKMNEELNKFRSNLDKALNNPVTAGLKTTTDALDNQAAIEASIRRRYAPPKVASTPDDNRAAILAKVTGELDKQLIATDQLNDARTAAQKLDQIDVQLATHSKGGKLAPLQALTQAEKDDYKAKLDQVQAAKLVEAAQDTIYAGTAGPLRTLNSGELAINNLLKNHKINADQAAQAQRALNFAYDSATDPLFQFNKQMDQQTKLLASNLDAKQRAQQSQVDSINNSLAPQGKKLTTDQEDQVKAQVAAQQKLNEVTQAYDNIVSANKGAYEQLTAQQEALNKAQNAGIITTEQYSVATTELAIKKAQLNLDTGVGTQVDLGLASIGRLLDGYKNVLSSLSKGFGDFFQSVSDGFADSVSHAIVFGGSLKDSLISVAQNAVQGLLSSLIKIGIQYALTGALGAESSATQTGAIALQTAATIEGTALKTEAALGGIEAINLASVFAAADTALAWAPAAAAVSLASFGANALPAATGIAETYALTEGLSALAGFQTGGYTGNGGVSSIAGVVHGQEFVMNAAATAENRGALEAMNAGHSVGSQTNVTIEDHTSGGVRFQSAPGTTPNEVRLIATDVAREMVETHSPKVIAADLRNPNSKTSKAMKTNYAVTPNR